MNFTLNISTCVRCRHGQPDRQGPRTCEKNHRDIQDNAREGTCPLGLFDGTGKDQGQTGEPSAPLNLVPLTVRRTHRGIVVKEPPPATADQVASYLTALLTADRVPTEVTAEREATCAACPHARWSREKSAPWCSICGCKVGGATRYLLRKLTEVAENLPAWGCHHPNREKGEGWKR